MKGLIRTILDDHRDVAVLRHAVYTFACLLNMGDNAITASFDDPLLNDIACKISDLKNRVKNEEVKNENSL